MVGNEILAVELAEPILNTLLQLDQLYEVNKESLGQISVSIKSLTENPAIKFAGLFGFLLLTFPRDIDKISQFFDVAMKPFPIPLNKKEGISYLVLVAARKFLFFYILYLAYQIFVFPFEFGTQADYVIYIDFIFQFGLLLAIFGSYKELRKLVCKRWDDNEEKQQHAIDWLDAKLAGMKVTPGALRSLAATVFLVNFAPAIIASLPVWLGLLSGYNKHIIQMLSAS